MECEISGEADVGEKSKICGNLKVASKDRRGSWENNLWTIQHVLVPFSCHEFQNN